MAKLYFNNSTMNAGKTTALLHASHNYVERRMATFLLTAALDERTGAGMIGSRIGLKAPAETFVADDDLFPLIEARKRRGGLHCVLVDEPQFLEENRSGSWSAPPTISLSRWCAPATGCAPIFPARSFPAPRRFSIADILREVRTICWCGSKATIVVRIGLCGAVEKEGDKIAVGDDIYVSLCR